LSHADTLSSVFATDPPKPPERQPATIRAEWSPPTSTCEVCGKGKVPEAFATGDGWLLLEVCPDDCVEEPETEAEWPFFEDRARPSDFRAAGWVVL
jgi:hypothetical protein